MSRTPPPIPPYPSDKPRILPFSFAWPLVAGVAAGGLLRLLFSGEPGGAYATMMWSFIFLSPMVVGAVTVYVAERQHRRSVGYYFGAGFLANLLYIVGTLVINVEGWICAILILPLFATLGGLGGLLMGALCRLTRWPRHATYSIAVLPLVLGAFESRMPLPQRIDQVQRTVLIAASPQQVWRQIQHADRIRPDEVERAWMYRIGVPLPEYGITELRGQQHVRRIRMGKGIHFDQVATDWQPGRHVRFEYEFAADSFPPRALDDHVRIGGHYFDLLDTSYTLEPHARGTALTVQMRYRVSTQFNWYAEPIARLLIGNFEDTILQFYRRRSESVATG